MLIEQTLERLHDLRLPGMAAALQEQGSGSAAHDLSFEDRLALLLEREITWRDNRRMQRRLQEAKLRLTSATPEGIDFRTTRGLDRSVLLRLGSADWVRRHQVVLILGPTGVGKTYVACALGHAACRHGLSTRYYRVGRLLGDLALARADGSYPKLLAKLSRTDLLILDDWGLAPLGDAERRDLLEILEDRYGRRATLVTSQLPMEHWHEYIGSPTLADAILDRLVHGAHKLIMKGGSMRKRQAAQEAEQPAEN
ncbi:MAG TPA: IS21-like element helper ATPase IstB [Longimicrobiales bacterium]|nr:IS21-like element helper ATPase IstB [Longimicrobiales bacterium]